MASAGRLAEGRLRACPCATFRLVAPCADLAVRTARELAEFVWQKERVGCLVAPWAAARSQGSQRGTIGSEGRDRTYDQAVNSRLLYH